tara:strand:+ start:303 stop:434 length:132 start_codon:yes stop_codon:yes gene_type:complete
MLKNMKKPTRNKDSVVGSVELGGVKEETVEEDDDEESDNGNHF